MNIQIIPEKCIACGLCHACAPDVFDYDDAGIVRFYDSEAREQDVPGHRTDVATAVKRCPTGALVARATDATED